MSETTIEWTVTRGPDGAIHPGFTFNAWRGCQKISPGCTNCYAEAQDNWLHGGKHWGPDGVRGTHSDAYWRKPLWWDRKAAKLGVRLKVFTNSIADVFEDRPELVEPRSRLLGLIATTPHLDWLMLTKRPENAQRLWTEAAGVAMDGAGLPVMARATRAEGARWMPNIWLGTTVEDQRRADERIPHLLAVPAAVRFLSCEPLLGAVDLVAAGAMGCTCDDEGRCSGACRFYRHSIDKRRIDWVIAGGESGHGARPMHPQWARSLRDQCASAGVPFLFKQWGEWAPGSDPHRADEIRCLYLARDGRAFTGAELEAARYSLVGTYHGLTIVHRAGKKTAGRLLDGRTHDEFPEVRR